MSLKKISLLAMSLALMNFPFLAHADLVTTNNSDLDSTVRVIHSGACAGAFGKFTPRHGTSDVKWGEVQTLCLGAYPRCSASIYMSKDCSGPSYGQATVNLQTHVITIDSVAPGSPFTFKVLPQEPNHLYIN